MAAGPTFILGGYQSDFARNGRAEGYSLIDLLRESAEGALESASMGAQEIGTAHVGNFLGEVYSGQGHLGGLLVEALPLLSGTPVSRHEAACASGSMAILAATADLDAGRADTALVVGVELMRADGGFAAQQALGAAAWVPNETDGVEYPWPHLFSLLADEYDRRYGLDHIHLASLGAKAFDNASRNPLAQTRDWQVGEGSFGDDDELNPVVDGWLRRHDCSQVSDGSAAVVLATAEAAGRWRATDGRSLDDVPRIAGWGHRTARMTMAGKLADHRDDELVMPHVRATIDDAFARAGIGGVAEIDAIETHDCFTISEYAAIDHFGLTAPGKSWRAIEDGTVELDGSTPVNPGGGLTGGGHPVGATGVRMLWDAARQVSGRAGECQVEGARTVATLNIGGNTTTVASFVVQG